MILDTITIFAFSSEILALELALRATLSLALTYKASETRQYSMSCYDVTDCVIVAKMVLFYINCPAVFTAEMESYTNVTLLWEFLKTVSIFSSEPKPKLECIKKRPIEPQIIRLWQYLLHAQTTKSDRVTVISKPGFLFDLVTSPMTSWIRDT